MAFGVWGLGAGGQGEGPHDVRVRDKVTPSHSVSFF